MFNLGFSEIIVLAVIALVVIGPKQLPEVARVIGRLLNEWKRTTSEITNSFTDSEVFKDWEDRKQKYFEDIRSFESPTATAVQSEEKSRIQNESTDQQLEFHIENDSKTDGESK